MGWESPFAGMGVFYTSQNPCPINEIPSMERIIFIYHLLFFLTHWQYVVTVDCQLHDKSFDSENVNHDALLIKWFTQINSSFYEFVFQADAGEDFIQYYPNVISILDSIEFVSTPSPADRVPSFMLGTNKSQVETDYEESEETVKIQGMNSFIQPNSIVNNIFTVVGEVHNIGNTSLTFVRPAITLYGSSKNVIGTDTTFTEPSSIAPGGSSSFKFTIFGNSILGGVNAVESYKVIVS
ncbi:MAG: hypothetical protein WA941_23745 [Nitrososphaeraceae archaeon]